MMDDPRVLDLIPIAFPHQREVQVQVIMCRRPHWYSLRRSQPVVYHLTLSLEEAMTLGRLLHNSCALVAEYQRRLTEPEGEESDDR